MYPLPFHFLGLSIEILILLQSWLE